VYVRSLAEYQRTDWLPFILLEAAYENELTGQTSSGTVTPRQLRQQAYEAYLSGAVGHFFGANPIWNFNQRPIFATTVRWQDQMNARGSRDMARVAALLGLIAWHRLVPDTSASLLTGGAGAAGTAHAVAARDSDGTFALAYMPTTRSITINLARLTGAVTARWYDPTNGVFTTVTGSPFANTGSRAFAPPSSNSAGEGDWLLVLTAP
jgi:hypothetical protein